MRGMRATADRGEIAAGRGTRETTFGAPPGATRCFRGKVLLAQKSVGNPGWSDDRSLPTEAVADGGPWRKGWRRWHLPFPALPVDFDAQTPPHHRHGAVHVWLFRFRRLGPSAALVARVRGLVKEKQGLVPQAVGQPGQRVVCYPERLFPRRSLPSTSPTISVISGMRRS